MKEIQKIIIMFAMLSLLFPFCVSASNNTSEIPDNNGSSPVTYQIGDYTITQDEAIGYFIFAVVIIIIIAWAMKPTKK